MNLGRLPFIPFSIVARNLQTVELFEISLLSEGVRNWIKLSGIELHAAGIIATEDSSGFFLQNSENAEGIWFAFEATAEPNVRVVDINGRRINVTERNPEVNTYFCTTDNFAADCQHLIAYFSSMTGISTSHVQLDIARLPAMRPVLANPLFTRHVEMLNLCGEMARNEDVIEIVGLFDNIKWLIMTGQYADDLYCPRVLEAENVDIENAKFVTVWTILFMKAKTARFVNNILTNMDINSIIRNWQSKMSNENLQRLSVRVQRDDFDLAEVLANLDVMPYDEKRRPKTYQIDYHRGPGEVIDTSDGNDIVRVDGIVATVGTKDGFLHMFVFPPYVPPPPPPAPTTAPSSAPPTDPPSDENGDI